MTTSGEPELAVIAVVYLMYSLVVGMMLILATIPSRLPTVLLKALVMSVMIRLPSTSVVGDHQLIVTGAFVDEARAIPVPVPASAAPAAAALVAWRNLRRLKVVLLLMIFLLLALIVRRCSRL